MNKRLNIIFTFILGIMFVFGDALFLSAQEQKEEFTLEEIVVTAERIKQTAQEIPRTIAVIDTQELQDTTMRTLADVLATVPGFAPLSGNAGAQPTIRGVGLDQTDPRTEMPVVAVNVDGMPSFGGQRANGYGFGASGVNMAGAAFDVERIEVVKGPSGTMGGQNALAGSVNIITRTAELGRYSVNGTIGIGNYDQRQYDFGLNVPLLDTFAFRVAVQKQSHDYQAFLRDITDPEDTENYGKTNPRTGFSDLLNARLRAKWQPTDKISLTLTASFMQDSGNQQIKGNPLNKDPWTTNWIGGTTCPKFPPICTPDELVVAVLPYNDGNTTEKGPETYTYQAELEWDMGFADINFKPKYSSSHPQPQKGTTTLPWGGQKYDVERQAGFDFTMTSKPGVLQWLAGAFFNETKVQAEGTVGEGGKVDPLNENGLGVNDAYILQYYLGENPDTVPVIINSARTSPPRNSKSVYGQATWAVLENTRLKAGIRIARDNQGKTPYYTGYGLGLPSDGSAPVFSGTDRDGNTHTNLTMTQAAALQDAGGSNVQCSNCEIRFQADPAPYKVDNPPPNFNLGAEYDINKNAMVYAGLNTGYSPGGVLAKSIPLQQYAAMRIFQYSLGIKSRWLDNTLQWNAEAYTYQYKHWHGGDPLNVGPFTYTDGNGTTYIQPNVRPWMAGGSQAGTLPQGTDGTLGGFAAFMYGTFGNPNGFDNYSTYGLDTSVTWLLTASDKVSADIAFLRNRFPSGYKDGNNADLGGIAMANAPTVSGRVSYEHSFNTLWGNLSPRLDIRYNSGYWTTNSRTVANSDSSGTVVKNVYTYQESFFKYDLYLNYSNQNGQWSANLWCKNIRNTAEVQNGMVIQNVSDPTNSVNISAPREYGMTVSFRF